jgi:hypothetical protein
MPVVDRERGITNFYHGVPPLPAVGEWSFCNNSVDLTCRLNTGRPYGIVEGHGTTDEAALAAARRRHAGYVSRDAESEGKAA